METLGDIRLFVEAANLGGLSAAGRKLGLSPAAASARLVKLEASLNARLFERTTRQLRLTEEGRMYSPIVSRPSRRLTTRVQRCRRVEAWFAGR